MDDKYTFDVLLYDNMGQQIDSVELPDLRLSQGDKIEYKDKIYTVLHGIKTVSIATRSVEIRAYLTGEGNFSIHNGNNKGGEG